MGLGLGSATGRRTVGGLLVLIIGAILTWWLQGDDGGTGTDPTSTPSVTESVISTPSSEPTDLETDGQQTDGAETGGTDDGMPTVALSDLPPEAAETVELIDQGGPFPYPDRDGTTFSNREGLLPEQPEGYYKEYTVETPGSDDRGARRIVAGSEGELYWTDDHYASFSRVSR